MAYKITIEKVDNGATQSSSYFRPKTIATYTADLPIQAIVSEDVIDVAALKAFIALLVQNKVNADVASASASDTTAEVIAKAHIQHVVP